MRSQTVLVDYPLILKGALDRLDMAAIRQAAGILFEAWQNDRSVYVCGNGGSWATAEHFACDLAKWTQVGTRFGLRSYALTLGPLATAFANDEGYDQMFARQLEVRIQAKDVLIGISCSGASQNVIIALDRARAWGASAIALTGASGMRPYWIGNFQMEAADLEIRVEADDIRIVEDCHLAICHMLAGEVRDRIQAHALIPSTEAEPA